MKLRCLPIVRWGVLGVLLLFILTARFFPLLGEWYATFCYPCVSAFLSFFSSFFPFSLGDCFIVGSCLWLLAYLIYTICKRVGIKRRLLRMLEFCGWVYVWFYLAWGLNYFRMPFYERTGIEKAAYSSENFQNFLTDYIIGLNGSYAGVGDTLFFSRQQVKTPVLLPVSFEVVSGYRKLDSVFGLVHPSFALKAKPMLFSCGMSRVGVTGYMGPFFSEFNLNRELLPMEYPFTYAHEMAHWLGIASEAEANLYAHMVCVGSDVPEIRFSGYFSLFGYVMGNARRLLPEEEYITLYKSVSPEMITLYKEHLNYWRSKYNPQAGKVQNRVYNSFLKSNQVSSGTKNYSEVVGLLISWQQRDTLP